MIILPNLLYKKIVFGYFPDLFKFVELTGKLMGTQDIGFYSSLTRPLEGLIFPGVKSKMLS